MKNAFTIPLSVALLLVLTSLACAIPRRIQLDTSNSGTVVSPETAMALTVQAVVAEKVQAAQATANAVASALPATTANLLPATATSLDAPTNLPTDTPSVPPATAVPPSPTEIAPADASALWVVFVQDGNVGLWREDGSTTWLAQTGDVFTARISSDGQRVAYVRSFPSGSDELWVVNTDATNARLLSNPLEPIPADTLGIAISDFRWVPNSHRLGYSTRYIYEGPSGPNANLMVADADSGTITPLFAAGQANEFAFSPDGSQVAISTSGNYGDVLGSVSIYNLDLSNPRVNVLQYPSVSTYSEWAFSALPTWSNDSQHLLVVIPPPAILENPDSVSNVYWVDVASGSTTLVNSINMGLFFGGSPVVTNDLSQIAYAYQPVDSTSGELAQLRIMAGIPESGISQPIFPGTAGYNMLAIDFSPENNLLAAAISDTGIADISIYLSGSGEVLPVPFLDNQDPYRMKWLSTQRVIYLSSFTAGNQTLQIADLDGFVTNLTSSGNTSGFDFVYVTP
jgi:hypothetical protein